MDRLTRLTFLALFFWVTVPGLVAQETSLLEYLAECERKYGSDADLVNGEKYFFPYYQSDGDPFLNHPDETAFIRVRGKEFTGQRLKYDIYSQQLVLDYEESHGGTGSIVLRMEWVESFGYGNRLFKKIDGPEGTKGYYQVVFEGPVSCFYRWSKQYLLNQNSGVRGYYFTDPQRSAYLLKDNRFISFRNNATFVRAFDATHQKTIKSFLRQTRIKVKRVQDPEMRHLMEYCNNLIDETD